MTAFDDDPPAQGGTPSRGSGLARRPNLLQTSMKMPSLSALLGGGHRPSDHMDLPEEGRDLHEYFRTCPSLTRLREEFRAASEIAEEHGENICARPEEKTGRLLLHCIGLNRDLILLGTGGSAAALSRVNQFVLHEVLPAHPGAVIEEDDRGRLPFTEPIAEWVAARRAVRTWVLQTNSTRDKVALMAQKWQRKASSLTNYESRQRKASEASSGRRSSGLSAFSDSDDSISVGEDGFGKTKSVSFRGFLSSHNDRKVARRELREIVESSSDAVFCIDEKGTILITNEAASIQFGWTKKELAGSNVSMICNEEDAKHHGKYLARYLETGEKRVMGKKRELTARRKDGSTFQIELGLTEVKLAGGRHVFCGFVKDLTEIKRHQNLLRTSLPNIDNVAGINTGKGDERGGGAGGGREEEGHDHDTGTRDLPPLVEWSLKILSDIIDSGSGELGSGKARHLHEEKGGAGGTDESVSDGDDILSVGDFSSTNDDLDLSFSDLHDTDKRNAPARKRKHVRSRHKSAANIGMTVGAMYDELIVEKVASIPHLMEELLLIEDIDARNRVFDLSIVRKVMFSTDSLGNGDWLIKMLDSGISVTEQKLQDANLSRDAELTQRATLKMAEDECRFLAEGVVFYLERISALNIQDDLYVFHNVQIHQRTEGDGGQLANMISNSDVRHFQRVRDKLFDTVGALDGLVRRVCVLDDDLVKRASVTPVIRRLLDKTMFSPFATSMALFDGFNHFLLVLAFRLGPAPAMFHLSKHDDFFRPQQYLVASAILMHGIAYFGIKAIHLGYAKYSLSKRLFWSDAFSFWSLLDTVPLVMVFFCSVAIDVVMRQRAYAAVEDSTIPFYLRGIVALTTPFLWLRVLAYVKVRNKQLATFILCSVEIMKDIKWFLLVLLVAMASFAQMWVSLTFEPDAQAGMHYENFSFEGYLKAYTIMLGDFDADVLKTHPIIVILFIIYTFGVTIVLLNILIAIVSDSYQNSFVSSQMMLGKARIMFIAELHSLQSFHKMWMEGKTGNLRRNVNYAFGTLAVIYMAMILGTVKMKIYQDHADIQRATDNTWALYEKGAPAPSRLNIEAGLVFIVLFMALFVKKIALNYMLDEFDDVGNLLRSDGRKGAQSKSRALRAINWFVQKLYSHWSTTYDSLSDKDERKVIMGRDESSPAAPGVRTDRKLIQRSVEKSKKELKAELKNAVEQMQLALQESEQNSQEDMSNLEERITAVMASAMAESEQRIIQAISLQLRGGAPRASAGDNEDPRENGHEANVYEVLEDQ